MSKQREALQMALKAIAAIELTDDFELAMKASRVIREALAEPEQEPVAWMCADEDMTRKGYSRFSRNCEGEWNIPVYTTPPARKPLTDEQINELELPPDGCTMRELVRAIERAHGIIE